MIHSLNVDLEYKSYPGRPKACICASGSHYNAVFIVGNRLGFSVESVSIQMNFFVLCTDMFEGSRRLEMKVLLAKSS